LPRNDKAQLDWSPVWPNQTCFAIEHAFFSHEVTSKSGESAMLQRLGIRERRMWALLLSASRRRWRQILCALFCFWALAIYSQQKHPFSPRAHEITAHDIAFEALHRAGPEETKRLLPLLEAEQLCRAHRWGVFHGQDGKRRRKVYDLFMVNNEMDWLEIRLNTMAAHVDYFVVLESAVTFTGLEKNLTLKENWDRFAGFHEQIIYRVVQNPPLNAARTWDLEDHQRNAMFDQVIPGLEGEQEARIGDVIIVSDVDEIIRPATLQILRNCDFHQRLTLRSRFYYYGFQFLHKGPEWEHPQATTFQGRSNTIRPANLRNGEGGNRLVAWWNKADLWNAGWHCSSCFATIEDMLTKMKSFSHVSLNQEHFRNRTRIVDRVRKGLDLWDREGELYEKIEGNDDIPEFLKGERERFKYLLDRQSPNAGFMDYGPEEVAGG
jgi:beta-1,4-mannosyl-glycoprotein beta-1,4-N-acetylglucosaminyltransferase